MTNLEWIRTLSAKELSDLLYDYWLPRGQYAWSDSRKGLMKVLSENHIERDCVKCKHQNNCYCVKGYGCPYEPIAKQTEPSLEQFRVGLEYHTDATHFGKAKGESITTDKTEQTEPQTDKHKCRRCVYYDVSSDYYPCVSCIDYSNYTGEITDCAWR